MEKNFGCDYIDKDCMAFDSHGLWFVQEMIWTQNINDSVISFDYFITIMAENVIAWFMAVVEYQGHNLVSSVFRI